MMDNENKATVVGRWVVKGLNSVVNLIVLIVCLLLLVFGSYVLFETDSVYRDADASVYNMYRPVPEETDGGPSFSELRSINPDIFAWLTVYGTHIDYPVAHADNNDKYINTDAMGEYSLSGSLFMDYNNAPGFGDFSSIIYGHYMEKDTMFGELASFLDQEYFDAHEYGELFFNGKNHGIRFFAFLEVDAYDGTIYRTTIPENEEETYVSHLLEVSSNNRSVEISPDDSIVLLSTCTSGSSTGRHILAGVINQEMFANPFAENDIGGSSMNKSQVTNQQDSFFARIDWKLWAPLIILLFLIVLYLLCSIVRRVRYESDK